MNTKKQPISLLCIGVLGFLALSQCIKYGRHYPNGEEALYQDSFLQSINISKHFKIYYFP